MKPACVNESLDYLAGTRSVVDPVLRFASKSEDYSARFDFQDRSR